MERILFTILVAGIIETIWLGYYLVQILGRLVSISMDLTRMRLYLLSIKEYTGSVADGTAYVHEAIENLYDDLKEINRKI